MSSFVSNLSSFLSNLGIFFSNLFDLLASFTSTSFEFLIVIIYDIPMMIINSILPGLPNVFSTCLTLLLSISIIILIVKFIMMFKFW